MLRSIGIFLVIFAVGGCASTATSDRLDALERQLADVQRTASEALDAAREARSSAAGVSDSVAEAQGMARQAMDAANEASERARRIGEECCGGK